MCDFGRNREAVLSGSSDVTKQEPWEFKAAAHGRGGASGAGGNVCVPVLEGMCVSLSWRECAQAWMGDHVTWARRLIKFRWRKGLQEQEEGAVDK